MNRFFYARLLLLLAPLGFQSSSTFAQATDVDNAKSVAKKDYVSARAKILQDFKYAIDQCSKSTGPAERACKIQAQAKREADEENARLTVDRAGYSVPLPDQARKKAFNDARIKAKNDYKSAIEKVMRASHSANTECLKLDGSDRKICTTKVAERTTEAKRQAKYDYEWDINRAKAIKVP